MDENVYAFRRYDHVERLGNDEVEAIDLGTVYVFPKLDGTNASVWWDNERRVLRAGSRNREISVEFDNHGFAAWLSSDDGQEVGWLCAANPRWILYGEWLVPHSLKTYREDAWRRFYVFDVFDRNLGRYLSWDEYRVQLQDAGVDVVMPLSIYSNPSREQLQGQVEANTFLIRDGAGVGEGIVLKNYQWTNRYGRQPWAKLVRNEFKEQNAAVFGIPVKAGETQVEAEIAAECVTPVLVGKTRGKILADIANERCLDIADPNVPALIEQTRKAQLIPQLLGRVYHDVVVEELWSQLKKHKDATINFCRLRHHVTARVKQIAADLFFGGRAPSAGEVAP